MNQERKIVRYEDAAEPVTVHNAAGEVIYTGWRPINSLHVIFGQGAEHYARWQGCTCPDGLYWWLHPTEKRWVGEPEQQAMGDFGNQIDAQLALMDAPTPPGWKNGVEVGDLK